MRYLVTGVAGFCGFHVAKKLLARGDQVIGVDNMTPYYSPTLKQARLAALQGTSSDLSFREVDICDASAMAGLFRAHRFDGVVHLAAQPGVRYSLVNPGAYTQNNLVGFTNILDQCRYAQVNHLVYASSSSVYGANIKSPFSEKDPVDHPLSLYAATKKANELLAHSYSHLFGLPTTGMRYFTVYGPWGRPDMAPWLFTEAILAGTPIKVFNNGLSVRDFTYVEDIAEATVRLLDRPPQRDSNFDHHHPRPDASDAPFRVYNIGNEAPVVLSDFIAELERAIGRVAIKEFQPLQPGDMTATRADVSSLKAAIGFAPSTPIADGLTAWARWYRQYHRLN